MTSEDEEPVDETKLSTPGWLLLKISQAKSLERLDALANEIMYDKFERMAYTLDAEQMAKIRERWAKKQRELKG